MTLRKVSQESVEEWRGHPVTEALSLCFADLLEHRRDALTAAFLSGRQTPQELESGRVEVQTAATLLDEFFGIQVPEMTEKINATLERMADE